MIKFIGKFLKGLGEVTGFVETAPQPKKSRKKRTLKKDKKAVVAARDDFVRESFGKVNNEMTGLKVANATIHQGHKKLEKSLFEEVGKIDKKVDENFEAQQKEIDGLKKERELDRDMIMDLTGRVTELEHVPRVKERVVIERPTKPATKKIKSDSVSVSILQDVSEKERHILETFLSFGQTMPLSYKDLGKHLKKNPHTVKAQMRGLTKRGWFEKSTSENKSRFKLKDSIATELSKVIHTD